MRPQDNRAHRRAQRQRNDGRNEYGHDDRHRELPEQRTGDARQETDRNKDGSQHQRRGDQRAGQLFHRDVRRLACPDLTLLHDALDVLDHNDRIVHHDTDGEDQSQQRQHVEREAHDQHKAESPHQRDRYRDDRDQRRTPAL